MTAPENRLFLPEAPFASERKLSQSVVQIAAILEMFHAELARVLGWRCADIGALVNGRRLLERDTPQWRQACLFVRMFQQLYQCYDGDGARMINWLRRDHQALGASPHLLMVDRGRVDVVLECLCRDEASKKAANTP